MDTDPFKIASRYFFQNFHWNPEDPIKNLYFYSTILLLTKSINIKFILDKIDLTKIIFHNVHILKVITEDEWEIHPYKSKILFEIEISYIYHDYVNSWFKFLLFQFPNQAHFWFLGLDCKQIFPLWLQRWWNQFVLIPKILPEKLQLAFKHFTYLASSKFDHNNQKFPYLFHLFKKYNIPWILK